jgi:hypothetical protein
MKTVGPVLFYAAALCIAVLSGCASGASAPSLTVTITSPTSSPTVGGGQSVNVIASVSENNSPSDGSVTWSLSGSTCGTNCGSLFNQAPTQVTYKAPASVSANFTVTVTATSATAPSKSAAIVINVSTISVSIDRKVQQLAAAPSPWPTASILVDFEASVQYDPNDGGVTWTLTAGGAPCSPACGTLSGPPGIAVTYTPPASVPAAPNNQPTLIATSISDPSKSDSDTFTLFDGATACAPGGNESELNGQYAILLQGWAGDSNATPIIYAAGFGADGTGKITEGQDRLNLPTVSAGGFLLPTASSYSVGSDGRGCLTLTDDSDETQTLRFSLGGINGGVASKGDVILFSQDPATFYNATLTLRASGILRQQDPSAFSLSALASNYAVGLDGWAESTDPTIAPQHFAMAGAFAQSGGTLSNLVFDANTAGTLTQDNGLFPGITFGTIGSVATLDGVASGNLSVPGGNTGSTNVGVEVYVINSSELFFVSVTVEPGVTFSGRAIAAPSSFPASSFAPAYIFQSTGSGSRGASASIGLMNFSTPVVNGGGFAGTVSGTLDQYSVGNFSMSNISESYAFGPLVGLVSIWSNPSMSGTPSQYLYLTTPYDGVAGFSITTDATAPLGVFDVEPYGSPGVPPLPALSGNFILGSGEPGDSTVFDISGVATAPSFGMPAFTGTEDVASPTALSSNSFTTGLFSFGSDGTGSVGPNTFAVTNGTELFFLDEGSGGPNFPPEVQIFQH